ncbi:hypothetical protein LTR36_003698 [Oleoguttula mirabilis]|uniref:Uncharacterized protein n=1 Tax=Oleoguttula mirabilis TaxID=1507867 RepID=A0AAV9JIP1_9PEZI|nr:hypothetical protein LTR36_003698 [Oleoguttula mirabilis]
MSANEVSIGSLTPTVYKKKHITQTLAHPSCPHRTQQSLTMGVLSGNEATQALNNIVKAIYLYTEAGNKQRTQILKGYAWGVFDLAAFSSAFMEEADVRVKQKLMPGPPAAQAVQEGGEAQRKLRPEQVADGLVWEALAEIEKVDEQKADAFRRVLFEEQNETKAA